MHEHSLLEKLPRLPHARTTWVADPTRSLAARSRADDHQLCEQATPQGSGPRPRRFWQPQCCCGLSRQLSPQMFVHSALSVHCLPAMCSARLNPHSPRPYWQDGALQPLGAMKHHHWKPLLALVGGEPIGGGGRQTFCRRSKYGIAHSLNKVNGGISAK